MFRQCRLPQPSPIQPLSGVKFRIPSRPSRASMRCLYRPAWVSFFFFCLSPVSLSHLFLSGDETSFLSPGVGRCPRIRSQLAHTGPTGPVTRLAGVVSLAGSQNRTQALTGPNSFFLPRTSLPSPFRGRGWILLFFGGSGSPWQLPLATAGHNWLTRAQ